MKTEFSEIKKIELICLYASHRLAFIDSIDHRRESSERYNDLTKFIYQMGYDLDHRFFEYFLKKLEKLNLKWLDKYFKSDYDNIRKVVPSFYFHPVFCTTCDSCHSGCSSVSKDEITTQRNKYNGLYICLHCEGLANNINDLNTDVYFFNGTGVYEDSGLSNRYGKYLGFAGSRFVIKTKEKGIILTNNLFENKSLHKCFYDKVKHKINSEIFRVKDFKKETLLKHLTFIEINSIKDQLTKAEKLEHKIV